MFVHIPSFMCLHVAISGCETLLVFVRLNVNGAVCWVNGSVHGYKGHECVYIIRGVRVCVSCRDIKSKSFNNQKGKYVKGCLQAKDNNILCVSRNIISLVKPEALEESLMALRVHL